MRADVIGSETSTSGAPPPGLSLQPGRPRLWGGCRHCCGAIHVPELHLALPSPSGVTAQSPALRRSALSIQPATVSCPPGGWRAWSQAVFTVPCVPDAIRWEPWILLQRGSATSHGTQKPTRESAPESGQSCPQLALLLLLLGVPASSPARPREFGLQGAPCWPGG